jgi:hypothetical protein
LKRLEEEEFFTTIKKLRGQPSKCFTFSEWQNVTFSTSTSFLPGRDAVVVSSAWKQCAFISECFSFVKTILLQLEFVLSKLMLPRA